MKDPIRLSWQTKQNWLIDAGVFIGALLAGLTGIYFLYLPSGYEGGRNPYYGINILFGRETWGDIHTWGGIVMILAVVIHFAIHWQWVKMMGRRAGMALQGKGKGLSRGAKINLAVDLAVGLSFLLTAVSGIYFLFLPHGFQGGRNPGWDPNLLFSRITWDLIHTWAAVAMILAASLHLFIHWRWVVNVTRRFFLSLRHQARAPRATSSTI